MSPPIQRQRVDLLLAGEALGFAVFAEQADSMDDGLILPQVPNPESRIPNPACLAVAGPQTI